MIDFACKQFDIKEIVKCSLALTNADVRVFELLLRQQKESFTTEEIASRLHLDLSTVQRTVKKLSEKKLAKRMQHNREGGGYEFHYAANDKEVIRQIILDTVKTWVGRVETELRAW